MTEKKNTAIIITAIFLVFIAIAIYFLFFREEEDYKPPDLPDNGRDGNGEDPPPGYYILKFDKTVSNQKKIFWNLEHEYYATFITGSFRVGGSVYTNVRTYVKSGGSWKHIGTNGSWPGGYATFEKGMTPHMKITEIKWEAEQGLLPWIGDRYIDEVHVQLTVEV